MRKIYFLVFVLLFQPFALFSQNAFTWVGGATGDYQVATNWAPARNVLAANDLLQFNASANIAVSNVPNQTIGALNILSGTAQVSFASNNVGSVLSLTATSPLIFTTSGAVYAADALTINLKNTAAFSLTQGIFGIQPGTGGKIIINSNLTINGATLDVDVAGTGGASVTGTVTFLSGTFNCVNAGALTWTNNAVYFHAVDGSGPNSIPISSWQTGSTCVISGFNTGTTTPGGISTNTFSNFTWNCANQINDIDLNLVKATIAGTLSIINTNNKYLRLAGAAGAIINAGFYNQTGGNIMLQSASGATSLIVAGNFVQTGGILDAVGGSAIGGNAYINLQGDVTKSGSWYESSTNSSAQMTIDFSGVVNQIVNLSGSWPSPAAGRCNITISNSNLLSGVTLKTGSKLMVYGNASAAATCIVAGTISPIDPSAYVVYNGNCTLQYAGYSPQTATITEFPLVNGPTNLSINNSLGVNFPAAMSSRKIPGTLFMLNGNLALGNDTLSLTNINLASQLNYSGGFITTGMLGRYFPSNGLPTTAIDAGRFPFGSGSNDRSLNVYFSTANLSAATAGMIYVSHSPLGGVVNLTPNVTDNGVTLDKRTRTNWYIGTGNFTLGTGTEKISITVTGANIGSVDNFSTLRLSDGSSSQYGASLMPNPSTGSNSIPVTGKSGLSMADINKTLYIASDGTSLYNPLVNITFNWTGAGGNSDWTNPANWTGVNAVGYPSASTEIAVINSTAGPQPTINTGSNISVYQLTVGAGITLTLAPNSGLNVYDTVIYNGIASFDATSTFGYNSSDKPQDIIGLQYGNLSLSGTANKNLPASLTITGSYILAGNLPLIGTGTIVYAGAGAQRISIANYYNLTITGDRGGKIITLGSPPTKGIIDIANNFDVSGLVNYTHQNGFSPLSYTDVNFSSTGSQTIPGFYYPGSINNTGNGNRRLDNLGSADINHVIYTRVLNPGNGTYINTGSKVNFYVTGLAKVKYGFPLNLIFNDLEISGDNKNYPLDFFGNPFFVMGNFKVSLTNFTQPYNNFATVVYNGTGNQVINAYKTNISTNTPAFRYPNIVIQGSNRNVTLAGSNSDTIHVMGRLQVPRTYNYAADYGYYGINLNDVPFSAGKGFVVDSSTINFISGSSTIPKLFPVTGTVNYNNVSISGGTQLLDTTNITIGGNLFVGGNDLNLSAATSPAILKVGDGASSRVLNVLGNVIISGASASNQKTGQIDLNPGTSGNTVLNIYKNLSIAGRGQLMSTGAVNGAIIFKGSAQHNFQNTGAYTNDSVNFKVGDSASSGNRLNLQSDLDLIRSNTRPGTITIAAGDTLDCLVSHIISNNTSTAGTAKFDLQHGATLITANTGGIEGAATTSSNGSLLNDGTLIKNYDSLASYIFNASGNTATSFPAYRTPFPLANVTFGDSLHSAIFTLNKSIDASSSLSLKKLSTLFIGDGNYFNLKSTALNTAMVLPVPDNANISYGTGRFVVERFFPSHRAWRLITAPITAEPGRCIFNSWQLGGTAANGSGTFVSGPGANSISNGLDVSPLNNSSLKIGASFTPIANTRTALLAGTAGTPGVPDNYGMFLFVRGDRSNTNLFNVNFSTATTLRDTGFVQIHQQSFTGLSTVANGLSLIGNPFASPVDFSLITKNNIVNRFWVWDPYINSSAGGYVEFDDYANTGTYTLSTPSPGGLSKLLQSSQAIFVQTANSGPASLVFNESNKSPVNNNTAFRPLTATASLRTNLFLRDQKDSSILADGNLAEFGENFSKEVMMEDAPKLNNIFETLGLQRDQNDLSIERRPSIVTADTLFLKLTKTKKQLYQFRFDPVNMATSLNAFLEDNYTNSKTPISLQHTDSLTFNITDDIKTAAEDRFKITFQNKTAAIVEANFKTLSARKTGKDILVNWAVVNETGVKKYEVEKSLDGINFSIISTIELLTGRFGDEHNILDYHAVKGDNIYRIKTYDLYGNSSLSKTVSVNMENFGPTITIYPNPVVGNKIRLSFNMEQGMYALNVFNSLGQIVLSKKISHADGTLIEVIDAENKLVPGVYQVTITDSLGRIMTVNMSCE